MGRRSIQPRDARPSSGHHQTDSAFDGRTDLEPLILDQAKAEILDQYLDSGKAKRVLGWTARHSLEDGLRDTIGWYQAYLETAARRPARA